MANYIQCSCCTHSSDCSPPCIRCFSQSKSPRTRSASWVRMIYWSIGTRYSCILAQWLIFLFKSSSPCPAARTPCLMLKSKSIASAFLCCDFGNTRMHLSPPTLAAPAVFDANSLTSSKNTGCICSSLVVTWMLCATNLFDGCSMKPLGLTR